MNRGWLPTIRSCTGARAFLLAVVLGVSTPTSASAAGGEPALAIEPRFEVAGLFHEGIAPVKIDGRWGFINRQGEVVLNPQYEDAMGGTQGRFAVRHGGRWGYVSTQGDWAIQPRFDDVRPFNDGIAAVREKGLWGYIRADGRYLVPPSFSQATAMDSGVALVVLDGRCKVLIPAHLPEERTATNCDPREDSWGPEAARLEQGALTLQEMADGIGLLRIGDLRYYANAAGSNIGPFTLARPFSEGLAAVRNDSKRWGFIHKNGDPATRHGYEGARDFSEGVAPVALDGKWGYIDKWERLVVKPQFDQAYGFSEGYAVIRNGDKRGFLEMDDRRNISIYAEPRYEDVYQFREGLAPVKVNGLWGYLPARQQPQTQRVRGIVDIKP